MKILLGTKNTYKVNEINQILGKNLESINATDAVESGDTFKDNALLKAAHYYSIYKTPIIADDSGLTVLKLKGQLGVNSKRYSQSKTDHDNNELLLTNMANISNRKAYFTCVCILYLSPDKYFFFTGKLKGSIAYEINTKYGFGYDSVFLLPDGKYLSSLKDEEKNQISHRAIAFKKLKKYLIKKKLYEQI